MTFPALARFGRSLVYGFKRDLRPYEAAILDAVLNASMPKDCEAIRAQFDSRERIQRWTDRVLYFSLARGQTLPLIEARGENYCYAKVRVISGTGERITAQLMIHKGLLSTLEFSKAPVPALSGVCKIDSVALHAGGKGYTDEIHEAEHGPKIDA
jgi:hypothetical protein